MRLRDQAYAAVTSALLDGRLRPGRFVTQRELVALTGLPLGAVREMIPRLEADGLMQAIAQRGLQVTPVDPNLVRDAYQLREIIEVAAVEQFVRTAPDSAVAALRSAHARVAGAAGHGPDWLADARAMDWALHDSVVAALGNPLLQEVHRINLVRIRMLMPANAPGAPMLDEHGVILLAIKRRDPADAVAALRQHLAHSRQRLLGLEAERPKKAKRK